MDEIEEWNFPASLDKSIVRRYPSKYFFLFYNLYNSACYSLNYEDYSNLYIPSFNTIGNLLSEQVQEVKKNDSF